MRDLEYSVKPVRHFIAVAGLTLACGGEEPAVQGAKVGTMETPETMQGVAESSEGEPGTEPLVWTSGEARITAAGGEQQASEKSAPAPILRGNVFFTPNGTCRHSVPSNCPPQHRCNPPPPRVVPCPPTRLRLIAKDNNGNCKATYEFMCEPDRDCGTKRERIECPELEMPAPSRLMVNSTYGCTIAGTGLWESHHECPDVFENEPNPEARYFRKGEECYAQPKSDCKPQVKCNPPPPQRVPCPPESFLSKD